VYSSIQFAVLYPMVRYARARGARVVVVCRGELYPPVFYDETSRSGQWFLTRILRAADLIVYKELYMPGMLDRLAPDPPRFLWSNAVPVGEEPDYRRNEDIVLFLNFFKRFRNLDVAIRAAALVRERFPAARFILVGGTSSLADKGGFFSDLLDYEKELLGLIEELGLEGYVEIRPFTSEVEPYYAAAKVYLLPSDLVFCNYALLEAMERGVPAVVTGEKDPDAARIVEEGVSGRVVRIDPGAVAEAVVDLLSDEDRRLRMARAAHEKIRKDYNLRTQAVSLAGQYRSLVQRNGTPAVAASPLQSTVSGS
jgi:glycosyltransferase involved in cell wall biosynthesis